jgi:serine/threonine-protein kinase
MATVPSVVGQTKEQAADDLKTAGFQVALEQMESDQPKGQVVETRPASGASVPEGATITVYYSDGQEKVPDVTGMQRAEAEQVLRDAGFRPNVVETTDTTEPAGTVIDQSPPAGEPQPENTTITIIVSSFVEPTEPTTPTDSVPTSPTIPTLPTDSATP